MPTVFKSNPGVRDVHGEDGAHGPPCRSASCEARSAGECGFTTSNIRQRGVSMQLTYDEVLERMQNTPIFRFSRRCRVHTH